MKKTLSISRKMEHIIPFLKNIVQCCLIKSLAGLSTGFQEKRIEILQFPGNRSVSVIHDGPQAHTSWHYANEALIVSP